MESLIFFHIKTLLLFSVKTVNSAEVDDVFFIQKSIYIGLAVLGMAMVIFLYNNFKKNLKRKPKKESLMGEDNILKITNFTFVHRRNLKLTNTFISKI